MWNLYSNSEATGFDAKYSKVVQITWCIKS